MPGSFSVAVGDADQYNLQIGGTTISIGPGQSGYADGKFFEAKQLTESFNAKEGTDGSVAWAKSNRRMAEFTLSLLQTAATNDFLSALHLLDVNFPNGAGIVPLVLQDQSGTTLIRAMRVRILKPADIELDREITMRVWTLRGPWDVFNVGSN